jgi:dienelactone hydrolase
MDKSGSKTKLCVGQYQTPTQGKKQLEKFAKTFSSKAQWEKRAAAIREGILRGAELWPIPPKGDLRPIIHGKRVHEGYSVENAAFESFPGFFVTGNLYRPLKKQKKNPAVLCPHGHFPPDSWGPGGRFRIDQQFRCATLARMGAVVFSYDMVGWVEDSRQTDGHKHPKVLALQLWNSIRATDFLLTLKEVEPKKIGITGASGGGTQTFLLAAVDDRVSVSVPVVMVSASFFGGCLCESGMPIHKSEMHETNNADIAACAAPRPQLVISNGVDWTKYNEEIEIPYLRTVYKMFRAEKNLEHLHLPWESHDYGHSKRQRMYHFMAEHLGLSKKGVTKSSGLIDESGTTLEKEELMRVFNSKHPRPKYALKGNDAVTKAFEAMGA